MTAPSSEPCCGCNPESPASSLGSIEVRILDRADAAKIDPVAWDRLADCSCTPNPWYERWNLLPALRHLDTDASVFVVAVYQSGHLVCLFPVALKRRAWAFRYLSLWQFRDCVTSNVLQKANVSLPPVIQTVMKRLRVSVIVSASHRKQGFEITPDCSFCQIPRSRRAVTQFTGWSNYEQRLPRKHRKENKRILARVIDQKGARYIVSDSFLASTWLPMYLSVEHRSWKAREGHTISSDIGRLHYYEELVREGEEKNKVEFQGLFLGDDVLAMSIRFRTQRNAYEVKTSYDERYKSLYPGVVLELLNVRNILSGDYAIVDSCATQNRVIERVWPDEITLYRTVIFKKSLTGMLLKLIYLWYRRIRIWTRHSSNTLLCN